MATKRFIKPFGEDGLRVPVSDTPSGTDVNYETGYPEEYGFDPVTDPAARFPQLTEENQIFNDITGNLKLWQENVFPDFITAANNGGVAWEYKKGDTVLYNGDNYESLEDNNTDLPTTEKWLIKKPNDVLRAILIGLGYSGNYGFFEKGFVYREVGDLGFSPDGIAYVYDGVDLLPVTVSSGTDPESSSDYENVTFGKASNVTNDNGGTAQDQFNFKDGLTVSEAINYSGIANLLGSRVWLTDRNSWFEVVLSSSFSGDGAGMDELTSSVNSSYGLLLKEDLSKPRVESFGASPNATASVNTAAINRAMFLCSQNGGGKPTISGGVIPYRIDDTMTAYRKVVLEGVGDLSTIIYLEDNTNKDMVKSEGFDSLTGTNSTTSNPLCPYSFGFKNIQFNGNGANQTAGVGMRLYGPRLILDKLMVYDTYDHCMYTEYSDQIGSSDPEGQEEGTIGSVICRNSNTGMGWLFRGPHNSVIDNLICAYNADWGFRNERSAGNYDGNITLINHIHTYANGDSGVDDKEVYFGAVTSVDYWIIDGGYGIIADNDCQINMVKLIFGGQSNHGLTITGDHNNIGMMNGSMLNGTSGYDVLRIEGDNNHVGRARLNGQTGGVNNHDGLVILGTGNTVDDLNARSCVRGCVVTGGLNEVNGKTLLCTNGFSYSTPTGTHPGKNRIDLEIYQTSGDYVTGDRPVDQLDQFNIQATGQGNLRTRSELQSAQIPLDVTTVQNVVIPHNLLYTPTRQSVSVTLLASSPTDTAIQPHQMVVSSVDATNITIAFRMQDAAAAGTLGRIGVKVKI